jgi:hypothetical protein
LDAKTRIAGGKIRAEIGQTAFKLERGLLQGGEVERHSYTPLEAILAE